MESSLALETTSQVLNQVRLRSGMSHEQLANQLRVPRSTVARWCSGSLPEQSIDAVTSWIAQQLGRDRNEILQFVRNGATSPGSTWLPEFSGIAQWWLNERNIHKLAEKLTAQVIAQPFTCFAPHIPPFFLLNTEVSDCVLASLREHGSIGSTAANMHRELHDSAREAIDLSGTSFIQGRVILGPSILHEMMFRRWPFERCSVDDLNNVIESWIEDWSGIHLRFLPSSCTQESDPIVKHFSDTHCVLLFDDGQFWKFDARAPLIHVGQATVDDDWTVFHSRVLQHAWEVAQPMAEDRPATIRLLRSCLTTQSWWHRAKGAPHFRLDDEEQSF